MKSAENDFGEALLLAIHGRRFSALEKLIYSYNDIRRTAARLASGGDKMERHLYGPLWTDEFKSQYAEYMKMLENRFKEDLTRKFLKAIENQDAGSITAIAKSIKMLKKLKPSPAEPFRAKILSLKHELDKRRSKISFNMLSYLVGWPEENSPWPLRRMAKQLKFPLKRGHR